MAAKRHAGCGNPGDSKIMLLQAGFQFLVRSVRSGLVWDIPRVPVGPIRACSLVGDAKGRLGGQPALRLSSTGHDSYVYRRPDCGNPYLRPHLGRSSLTDNSIELELGLLSLNRHFLW
jgi:hypothetical protein